MKVTFPSFAVFALVAAIACGQTDPRAASMAANTAGSSAVAQPPDGAELFIERMLAAANQLQSVQARIRYRANLFGQQIIGAGLYLQQGHGDNQQFRLELKTAVGQQLSTFQQVCDGKYLWQYRDTFNKPNPDKSADAQRPTITRVDLLKVRQSLEDGQPKHRVEPIGQLALGGLPKLLDGLQHSFRFTRVEAGQLDTLPAWIAVGSWRAEALAPISKELADQVAHEKPLNLKVLPPQLPEQVWLYVGQDDFFPYRIEFRRRADAKGRGAANVEMLPIVTCEFYEVRLNAAINPHEFDYQPGDADILDTTSNVVKELQAP
jgi:hypothetical protein